MLMVPWGPLPRLATLSILVSACAQASDPLVGGWGGVDSREGRDAEVVVIFTPEHQVAVWFDPTSGDVIHTNGGLWSRTGSRVTETVEFDSDNPERAGSSVSFDIELTDGELSIVGSSMRLSRIDAGDGDLLHWAWEVYDSSVTGTWEPTGSTSRTVRLMSSTRFQEVEYEPESGRLLATAGGQYSLDEQGYVETVEFSSSGEALEGRPVRYRVEWDEGVWRQIDGGRAGRAWRRR